MTKNSVFNVSIVSGYLSRKFVSNGRTCEFPRASFKAAIVPAPLANVSSAKTMSEEELAIIAEIAAEIGAEITDLYESANNEESDYRDMREFTAMSRINELSDMAGSIANDSRIRNASIMEEYKNSPAYSLAVSLIDAFGGNKNVVTVINSHSMVELYSAKSDLTRGIDTLTFIGKAEFWENTYRFYPVDNKKSTRHAIAFDTFSEFFAVLNSDKMFPARVNNVKSRALKFRNGPKGAKNTAIANPTEKLATAAIHRETVEKEKREILDKAAEFGYFPLPSFQGEKDITAEDKKTRASMKKRNQRAKAAAVKALDEKKLSIMAMVDEITAKALVTKSEKRAADKADKAAAEKELRNEFRAIISPKNSDGKEFDISEYFAEYEKEREDMKLANDKARTEWAREFSKRMTAYEKRAKA